MSLSISSRLKLPKKMELMKSQSQAQLLANKLRSDGVLSTVQSVMQAVDQLAAALSSNLNDPNVSYRENIMNLCQHLKVYGAYLEMLYTDQLNHAFNVFRDKAQEDTGVDQLSRLHLLELIELRAKGWKGTEGMNQYYRKRLNQYAQNDSMMESTNSLSDSLTSITLSPSSPMLSPGEVLKSSGKFSKPTRIPGKKYCKDEVVIKNADSGKVMGIKGRRVHMIEELSETIISFQRVSPGAKERLVQITGANEESICLAKQIMEDTIRRNASPIRDHGMSIGAPLTGSSSSINSSASDDSALPPSARISRIIRNAINYDEYNHEEEYKYSVVVGHHHIVLAGRNLDLVRTCKLVLDEYFSGETLNDIRQFYSYESLPRISTSFNDLTGVDRSTPPSPQPTPVLGSEEKQQSEESETDSISKLRKPYISIEDILRGNTASTSETTPKNEAKTSPKKDDKATPKKENQRLTYSIEDMANLAMSPMCLQQPPNWENISADYPVLVRQNIKYFNGKQYLIDRENIRKALNEDDKSTDEDEV